RAGNRTRLPERGKKHRRRGAHPRRWWIIRSANAGLLAAVERSQLGRGGVPFAGARGTTPARPFAPERGAVVGGGPAASPGTAGRAGQVIVFPPPALTAAVGCGFTFTRPTGEE